MNWKMKKVETVVNRKHLQLMRQWQGEERHIKENSSVESEVSNIPEYPNHFTKDVLILDL